MYFFQIGAVSAFSQTLRRYTSLNHLAQAARAVLQNSTQIGQMLSDLNRVDFANVQVSTTGSKKLSKQVATSNLQKVKDYSLFHYLSHISPYIQVLNVRFLFKLIGAGKRSIHFSVHWVGMKKNLKANVKYHAGNVVFK